MLGAPPASLLRCPQRSSWGPRTDRNTSRLPLMTYLSDIDDLARRAPVGCRTRHRPPLPFRGAHAKFARLETLEHRLLFVGDLDPSFGVGGRSRIDVSNLSEYASAVHVLPDGKILVAGRATLGLS